MIFDVNEETVTTLFELVTKMAEKIDRMEAVLSKYEPMLEEASRRMAGPIRFRRNAG